MTVSQGETKKLAAPAPKAEATEGIPEPKKREEKKEQPTPKLDLKAVMSGWSTDDA
jgi:hypothetical protein